jgi:hypothetical protein
MALAGRSHNPQREVFRRLHSVIEVKIKEVTIHLKILMFGWNTPGQSGRIRPAVMVYQGHAALGAEITLDTLCGKKDILPTSILAIAKKLNQQRQN